jgi:hypothetical protein
VMAGYLKIELDLGATYCQIAAESTEESKFSRNIESAERVCETVRRFTKYLEGGTVSSDEIQWMEDRASQLEEALGSLCRTRTTAPCAF